MNQILFSYPNVIGYGKGFKTTRGERVGEALVVLVEKKLPLELLKTHEIIPEAFDGNVTDVLEVGRIKALSYDHRLRPIQPGTSIGHISISAGTLGAIVEDTHTGRKLILSNNHVLAASNDALEGDPILQPGKHDGGKEPDDIVGHLFRFVPIEFSEGAPTCPIAKTITSILNWIADKIGSAHRLETKEIRQVTNLVDAAAATIYVEFNDEILDIGKVEGAAEVSLGEQVQKTGRTTEHTSDQVLLLNATIQVSYGEHGNAVFSDQLVAGPMSAGGDSGSLVLNMQNEAVGLLFAGSDQVTIFNRIVHVMAGLRIGF